MHGATIKMTKQCLIQRINNHLSLMSLYLLSNYYLQIMHKGSWSFDMRNREDIRAHFLCYYAKNTACPTRKSLKFLTTIHCFRCPRVGLCTKRILDPFVRIPEEFSASTLRLDMRTLKSWGDYRVLCFLRNSTLNLEQNFFGNL
jgi:hypothetical protein